MAGERLIPHEKSKVSRCIKQSKRITFLARDGGDGAYLALTLSQTQLEFRATGSRAGSLSLNSGRCCGKRYSARIGTGAKRTAANILSVSITSTGRKGRFLTGRNRTSVGTILLLGGLALLGGTGTEDGSAAF